MHSELFRRWQRALQEEGAAQRRFHEASIHNALGLEPHPSERLHRELEQRQAECRSQLFLLLRELATGASHVQASDARSSGRHRPRGGQS